MKLSAEVIVGDNRQTLKQIPDNSVQTVVTSPPYWGLRDYGNDEQIGLETDPNAFIEELCLVFDEIWRVLKDDGTLWVNLGDSYFNAQNSNRNGSSGSLGGQTRGGGEYKTQKRDAGDLNLKQKDLVGIPWRFAFAMQDRGWYLRQDIIWHKPNPMPESVTDRCTKSHEYIFLLTKNAKYYYDHEAIKEPVAESTKNRLMQPTLMDQVGSTRVPGKTNGNMKAVGDTEDRNKRSVWTVTTSRYKEAHFATYPPDLILPCIMAGSKEGDIVLDPFSGSGTTGEVALQNNRNYIGLELNPEYAELSRKRLLNAVGMMGDVYVR